MTNSTIAATGTRVQASQMRAKQAEASDEGSFSAVLALKLGMGLNAAVEVAQGLPMEARETTAEPARESAKSGEPQSAQEPADSEDETIAEGFEGGSAEKNLASEVDAKNGVESKRADNAGQAKAEAQAEQGAERGSSEAANQREGQRVETLTESEQAARASQQTPGTQNSAAKASAKADSTAQAALAAGGAERSTSETTSTLIAGKQTRPVGVKAGKLGKDETGDVAADRAPQARDPLGLIRERQPEPIQASATEHGGEKKPNEASPSADLGLVQPRHAEPTRVRFADAGQEQAARAAASSTPVQIGTPVGATPQSLGSAAVVGSSGRVVGVAASSGSGGAGMGGAGVGGGGGAGGGAGFGHEFGGLFAGGRAFGVGFGTPAKGKTAVGVASAKGESKEQIQAQISRGLAAALRQKGGVMSLRLNPEHLGSMKIDLTIEGGRVTATFDAQSEQARRALRDGVDGLKRSIEEAGLTVKSIDVVGTTPLATTNPASSRDDRSSQTAGDATGQHGQNGDQSGGKERREHSAPWAQEQPEAQVSPEAVGPGGVWAEEDGSASGLLRLRVDAVV